MSAITKIDELSRQAIVEVARLENINQALLEAAKQVLPILHDRWRSLPVDSHEKITIEKIRTAISQADGGEHD